MPPTAHGEPAADDSGRVVKPYYADDAVTIYHGDCREILPALGNNLVAATDPPYGVGKADWDDALPLDLLALTAVHTRAMAIMPGVWNIGRMPEQLESQRYVWTLSAYLTNGMTHGAVGFGNWIPCLLYALPGTSLHRTDGDARAFVVGTEDKPSHPSPKPIRVMTWIVSRLPDGVILDPFLGSGTTLLAAKVLGRQAIGIEIDERHCEEAARRCSQEVLGLSA